MTRPPFDRSTCAVVYPLFNDGWDFVVGNRKNQLRRNLSSIDRAQALPRYLNYVAHSITSLRREHGEDVDVTVKLVQIAEEGIATDELAHLLSKRVPGAEVAIDLIPFARVRPFMEAAMEIPLDLYRSPNQLHEFLILELMRTATRPYLAIVDSDVTFLAPDVLWNMGAALVAQPERAVAAFLETSHDKPWQGEVLRTRERMHSFLLLVDVARLRDFPWEPFSRVSSLEDRVAVLGDASVRDYYLRCRVLDTLAIMTEWLRQGGVDRVLDLSTVLSGCRQGAMLTLVSEAVLHAKFLEQSALPAIREAIDAAPYGHTNARLKSIRERLGSGLILAR